MKIEPIIYHTTREIYNIEDKLSIASLILFCRKLGSKVFCKLLYTDNHEEFISKLSSEYEGYGIDLSIKLNDKLIREGFYKTIEKVKEKYDVDGYLKALFEGDEFAVVIDEIVNYNFDNFELKKYAENVNEQLKLTF